MGVGKGARVREAGEAGGAAHLDWVPLLPALLPALHVPLQGWPEAMLPLAAGAGLSVEISCAVLVKAAQPGVLLQCSASFSGVGAPLTFDSTCGAAGSTRGGRERPRRRALAAAAQPGGRRGRQARAAAASGQGAAPRWRRRWAGSWHRRCSP
jgi:hypothetical protein